MIELLFFMKVASGTFVKIEKEQVNELQIRYFSGGDIFSHDNILFYVCKQY